MTKHLLERTGLGVAAEIIRRLSWERAQDLGAFLGRAASFLAVRRWRLTLENLRRAFPDRTEEERRAWGRAAWENLGRMGAECIWADGRPAEDLLAVVELHEIERLRPYLQEGGAILHLGHLANWEVAGAAFSAGGWPLTVVARRIKNPYVDKRINSFRTRFGGEVVGHKHPFFGCVKALKRGRALAILMDQKLPDGGVFVNFFGRPAATTTLTALLAHKTGRPIFSFRLHREGRKIHCSFEGPFRLGGTVEETTARLTGLIEDWARERPGEWFWFHDRWKRAPALETAPC